MESSDTRPENVNGRTILVAEGDSQCRVALRHHLKRAGYQVSEAHDPASSLQVVFAQSADLVILDLGPAEITSEVLARIRRRSTVPVIVCAAQASERDRVRLLNLGADDFMTKPFSFAELEARVRAVLRRGNNAPSTTLEHGDLVVDRGTRTVTVARHGRDDDPERVRPPRLLGGVAGPGLLSGGPARASLGFDRPLAGTIDGHRAHPAGPPQDRDGSREPAVDHHRAWNRLPLLRTRGLTYALNLPDRQPDRLTPAGRIERIG